jgi:putative hydrolase of the HAD superfamily
MTKTNSSRWDAVIFDYGRVLSYAPGPAELREFAELTGVGEPPFFELYSNTRDYYDRGHADYREHWQRFAEVAQVQISPATVEKLVAMESDMWTRPNPEMLELTRAIKSQGLKTAILSNMPLDLLAELRRKFDWLDEFDIQTWSCELGIIKPDAEIYHACLAGLRCEPDRALFFDDRLRNVEGAQRIGMEAHVFESASQAREIVERGLNLS